MEGVAETQKIHNRGGILPVFIKESREAAHESAMGGSGRRRKKLLNRRGVKKERPFHLGDLRPSQGRREGGNQKGPESLSVKGGKT